jgi:hypothetical protein
MNQLEGRVKGGKWFVDHPTSQFIHGVANNRPKTYIPQSRRPTMPTKFYGNAMSAGPGGITDFKLLAQKGKQNRPDTEASAGYGQFNSDQTCTVFGQAPIGKIMTSPIPMPANNLPTWANSLRPTLKRGAAGYRENGGYWECPQEQQGTNRFDLLGPAGGSVPNIGKYVHDGVYVNYTDRGQINPFVINATGTASSTGGLWNPNSVQQPMRVTRKETLQFSHTGNLSTGIQHAIPQIQDLLKTTRKETTQFAFQGNVAGNAAGPGMQMSRGMYEQSYV